MVSSIDENQSSANDVTVLIQWDSLLINAFFNKFNILLTQCLHDFFYFPTKFYSLNFFVQMIYPRFVRLTEKEVP